MVKADDVRKASLWKSLVVALQRLLKGPRNKTKGEVMDLSA
jgi:hypothetical protein